MKVNCLRKNIPLLFRQAAKALPGSLLWAICGCSRAPTFNILGSFFPAWLICMIGGIVVAALGYRLVAYLKLEKDIKWSIVVYPCMALSFACVFWLVFFS